MNVGTSLILVVAPFVFVIFAPSINIMIMAAKRSDKNDGTKKRYTKKAEAKKTRERERKNEREANEYDKKNV
jgi:hypothetical protein